MKTGTRRRLATAQTLFIRSSSPTPEGVEETGFAESPPVAPRRLGSLLYRAAFVDKAEGGWGVKEQEFPSVEQALRCAWKDLRVRLVPIGIWDHDGKLVLGAAAIGELCGDIKPVELRRTGSTESSSRQ